MGFFSADCTGCSHPLLSSYVTISINDWMRNGVTIFEDGSIIKGLYDGYGRYERPDNMSEAFEGVVEGTVWHQACWDVAGNPIDYRGVSKHSDDQGYFFEDPAHSMAEPTVPTGPPSTSPSDTATVQSPSHDPVALRAALRLLTVTNDDGQSVCERTVRAEAGSCFTLNGHTADARYGIDLACASCIASYALAGKPIPTGPGAHADE